jgi:hypothetical protein
MKRPLLLLAATLVAAPLAAQTATPPNAGPAVDEALLLERGRKLTDWLLAAQADSILAYMTEDTRTRVGGRGGITEMSMKIATSAGEQAVVVEEKMTRRNGKPQFWRQAKFDGMMPEPLVFRWVFDSAGYVVGAGIQPLSQAPAPDK